MHDRDPGGDRGVVEDVAGLERVGAVEDDVVAGDDPVDVVGDQHLLVRDDVDVGVERVEGLARGVDLLLAHAVGGVDDLALEVREVDDVEVDDADRAHARGGEVERGRRAEPAGADQQHLRLEQLRLARRADLGDQQVTAVADLLLVGQAHRLRPLEPLALPRLEAALHRGDVGVAHPGQRLGREQRPDRRRRSTGRRARRGRAPRPRSPARGSSWTRGRRRARGPGPTRTPRGRRSARRHRAGAARPPRPARSRGSRRGLRGGARHRSWASGMGAPGDRRAPLVGRAVDERVGSGAASSVDAAESGVPAQAGRRQAQRAISWPPARRAASRRPRRAGAGGSRS